MWPLGSKGTSWVASVHFPYQIEFELLLFPGNLKGFWKTRAGGSLLEVPRPTFFPAPVLPSRGRLLNRLSLRYDLGTCRLLGTEPGTKSANSSLPMVARLRAWTHAGGWCAQAEAGEREVPLIPWSSSCRT